MIRDLSKIILVSVLIFAGTVSSLFSQEAIGKVIALEGKVEAKSEGSQSWRVLNLKDDVYEKDTIKTGEDSQVEIFFVDETTVSIGPETTIKIEKLMCSPAKNYREGNFELIMGKARFDVGRLFSKDSTFEVRTPTAVAGVKSTRFIVWVTSSSELMTRLAVIKGIVAARNISPLVRGEVLMTGNFMTIIRFNTQPDDPNSMGSGDMEDFNRGLGIFSGGIAGGRRVAIAKAIIRRMLLRRILSGLKQTDIIDQPKEEPATPTPTNILPEPPAPPPDVG